jgi:hypothetical protein
MTSIVKRMIHAIMTLNCLAVWPKLNVTQRGVLWYLAERKLGRQLDLNEVKWFAKADALKEIDKLHHLLPNAGYNIGHYAELRKLLNEP